MKSMKKIISLALISSCVLTGVSIQASGKRTTETSSVKAVVSAAINNPNVWEFLSGFKIDRNMKNYYTGFHDSDFGISLGYGGLVSSTNDSGKTWMKGKNQSLCLFGLDIVDDNIAWLCGNGGNVRVTKDGGKSWKAVANFGSPEPNQCRFLSFIDEKTGWIASPKKLAVTIDGGKSWKEEKLPDGAKDVSALRLRTEKEGYLLDSHGSLFATENGGKNWSKHDLGFKKLNILNGSIAVQNSPSAAIYFSNKLTGMVIFHALNAKKESLIYDLRTFDGGKTWTQFIMPCKFNSPSVYLSNNAGVLTLAERNKNDLKQRDSINIYFNVLSATMND